MALNINKLFVVGRLTEVPELRQTPSGKQVAEFVVATNEYWSDGNGGKQQRAEFHRIVCWNALAESCAKYLVKGQAVYIEGSLRTRSFQGEDGAKRTVTFCLAQLVKFLEKPRAIEQRELFDDSQSDLLHAESTEQPQQKIHA